MHNAKYYRAYSWAALAMAMADPSACRETRQRHADQINEVGIALNLERFRNGGECICERGSAVTC